MSLRHLHFRRKDGSWGLIMKEHYPLFVEWVKRGKISAVDAETLTPKEGEVLQKEGFALVPDEMVVGIALRPLKILRIERS